VLVCDGKGALSIAGVMGGAESEVTADTRNVLLEGAAWNFINIRRTAAQHNLPSEASFRFSRGVHRPWRWTGCNAGLQYMSAWSGGKVAPGLVDEYPQKPRAVTINFTLSDVKPTAGIELSAAEVTRRLQALDFKCRVEARSRGGLAQARCSPASGDTRITVTAPPHGWILARASSELRM